MYRHKFFSSADIFPVNLEEYLWLNFNIEEYVSQGTSLVHT